MGFRNISTEHKHVNFNIGQEIS